MPDKSRAVQLDDGQAANFCSLIGQPFIINRFQPKAANDDGWSHYFSLSLQAVA